MEGASKQEGVKVKKSELIGVFKEVFRNLCERPDRCGNLIYTQSKDDRKIIREPEATYVLASVLSRGKFPFGLQVPTRKKYRISSDSADSANTDLAVNPNGRPVNVELKRGQCRESDIRKDFEKLLRERASGCAFYHILKNRNRGTLPKLLKKYKNTYNRLESVSDRQPKWFLLFIFVKEKRECFWKISENITELTEHSFDKDYFERESLCPT
ncbi:MAG: hypothetical protein ACE5IB_06005 [Candidatus Geothermarchaeales archaeon]